MALMRAAPAAWLPAAHRNRRRRGTPTPCPLMGIPVRHSFGTALSSILYLPPRISVRVVRGFLPRRLALFPAIASWLCCSSKVEWHLLSCRQSARTLSLSSFMSFSLKICALRASWWSVICFEWFCCIEGMIQAHSSLQMLSNWVEAIWDELLPFPVARLSADPVCQNLGSRWPFCRRGCLPPPGGLPLELGQAVGVPLSDPYRSELWILLGSLPRPRTLLCLRGRLRQKILLRTSLSSPEFL